MVLHAVVPRLRAVLVVAVVCSGVLPAVVSARPSGTQLPMGTGNPSASTGVLEHPLADLSQDAAGYLATRAGSVGVAVVVPGQRLLYGANSGFRFPLASLVKLDILLAVLDRAIGEGRELTARETRLLQAMIEQSDNDAATALWQELGGQGVQRYLQRMGMADFQPGLDVNWGASLDTAADVARLLAGLADGTLLDAPNRTLALVLLSRIEPSQRWGVIAGLPAGALLAFKNGWVEADGGVWRLHSAGVVFPGRLDDAYAVAVLTEDQPNLQYGVQTIETVAAYVHAALAAGR